MIRLPCVQGARTLSAGVVAIAAEAMQGKPMEAEDGSWIMLKNNAIWKQVYGAGYASASAVVGKPACCLIQVNCLGAMRRSIH